MEIQNLRISSVKPSPMNPRKTIDETALQELADNIRQQGLLQPITVRPKTYWDEVDMESGEITSTPTSYEVVCGERRYRACVLNGAETISAIVREMTDDEAFDAMITENLQRKDVDPIEEAYAFSQLIAKGATAEEVALRFGKSIRFVQDRIKLNSLIPELIGWVRDGKLPLVSAMILAKLSTEDQESFFNGHSYTSSIPKETAMNFVNNLFCYLDRTPWSKEKTPFTGGCGVACSECQFNSSNAGCLFYEMKTEPKDAKCTDRSRMEEKLLAYLKEKLAELDSVLVKKGGSIEKGKMFLVDNGAMYNGKGLYERVIQIVDDLGYEIFEPSRLGDKCWYREDDERTIAMLERGEVVKGLSLSVAIHGPNVLVPCFFYTKKRSGEEIEPNRDGQEAVRLAGQYAEVEEKAMNGVAKTLVEKLIGLEPSTRALSNIELAALVVAVLLDSDNETKHSVGLTSHASSEAFRHVIDHPESWGLILRKWLFAQLQEISTTTWKYSKSADEAIRYLAEDLLPHEYEQTMVKAEAAIDKKRSKIAEQLAALGYGTDGKLLEFKDTTHYAQD